MNDFMKNFTDFQAAWMRAAQASAQGYGQMVGHWLELQQKMMHQAAKYHRDHVEIATGPSLTDKYGKRAHDIDPEKDV